MPEPAGRAAMVYGIFDFGWFSPLAGAANMRTVLRADRLLFGRHRGRLDADRPTLRRISLLLRGGGAAFSASRSMVATGAIDAMACRITMQSSRICARLLAGRAVGTGVRKSR